MARAQKGAAAHKGSAQRKKTAKALDTALREAKKAGKAFDHACRTAKTRDERYLTCSTAKSLRDAVGRLENARGWVFDAIGRKW
jgi:hypothetical protein